MEGISHTAIPPWLQENQSQQKLTNNNHFSSVSMVIPFFFFQEADGNADSFVSVRCRHCRCCCFCCCCYSGRRRRRHRRHTAAVFVLFLVLKKTVVMVPLSVFLLQQFCALSAPQYTVFICVPNIYICERTALYHCSVTAGYTLTAWSSNHVPEPTHSSVSRSLNHCF